MLELSEELIELLAEEGTDVLAAYIGENACDNSLVYQSLFYVLSKGIEFVLPTLLSASFGDPTAFTLGLIRRDINRIQKDLDYFREIPFHQIKYLIEEVQHDLDDEENHFDAYEKFRLIERKSIESIFSSKKFEHKIKAAEISILAKSYIKRFNQDSRTFEELFELEEAKRKSLASQMMKLLTEFENMPEYIDAKESSKDAWYRLEHKRRENHSIVDQVDNLKISVYTNSVLCLPAIQESKVYLWDDNPVLVKSWKLFRSWIPEGERQALETSLTRDDLSLLFSAEDTDVMDEFGEFNWIFGTGSDDEESVEQDQDEGSSNSDEEESSDEETFSKLPKYFIDKTDDENLSENEDEVNEEDLEEEASSRPASSMSLMSSVSIYEQNSVEVFGTRFDPFRIYTNLYGTVFIKSGLKCKLFLNGEVQEESDVVQNAWRIDEPSENLRLEFLIRRENLRSINNMSVRRLNLTEKVGMELIDLLSGNYHCSGRARMCLHGGTISLVQWSVPYSEVHDALETERDIQSPLFQPLPLDGNQPYFKAIIDGRSRKAAIKKFGWTSDQNQLVAGIIVWNTESGAINTVGRLKTLSRKVKDLQMRDIDWDGLSSCEAENKMIRMDIFFFSFINCNPAEL